MSIEVGQAAPDLTLPDQDGKPFSLSELKGKSNALLVFYALDWTSI